MARFPGSACNRNLVLAAVFCLSAVLCGVPEDTARWSQAAEAGDEDQAWFRAEAKPAELRQAIRDNLVSDRWIYHDLDAARAEARKSGKPLLAVFQCVPCGSAPKLDQLVSGTDSPLGDLLDRFVCVRVVKMNGVNRNVFDFDRDVPFMVMVLNADGAVYGRWGTRVAASRSELPRHTIPSLRTALERALGLHGRYPANRAALAGKSPSRIQWPAMPEDMPTMQPDPGNPPEVQNCIHCHMVGAARLAQILQQEKPALRDLWPYPLADNLGLRLDPNEGLKVRSVLPSSPAEHAGVRAGDDLLRLNGQPLISEADVQWVLHHLDDDARPTFQLVRDGTLLDVTLILSGAWRRVPVEWRESLSPARPDVHLRVDHGKVNQDVAPGEMALRVYYPRGRAAKAGLRSGDLVISVDGRKDLLTEADFLKYIHLDRPEADSAELVLLRNADELTLTLPLR